ncbi:MAG: PAS domain S-box protein [Trueperaceae bacterium]|nr:PAS domain S-box protein [Trueperaceae bacterium]
MRAPFHGTGEGMVICAFYADLEDGCLREHVQAGFDSAMLAGLGDTEPTRIDAARLRAAGPGVPDWAGSGLWLPNAEDDAVYRGLVVVAPSPDDLDTRLATWLEVASSIVAGHAARLVATTSGARDAILSGAVDGSAAHGSAGRDATTAGGAPTPQPSERRIDVSNRGFRALIEHSHSATLLVDPQATILYASPAAERILQVPAALQLGQYAMGLIHPDDVDAVQERLERALEAPGAVFESRVRIHRADGAWRWIDVTMTNLLSEPTVGALVVNYLDVTERVVAEQALESRERHWRALLANSSDVIARIDAQGTILYANDAFASATGHALDDVMGRSALEWVHPDDAGAVRDQLAGVASSGRTASATYRFRRSDGGWRWWESVASNHLDDPSVEAMVVNARDVTERRRAQEEASRQQDLLHASMEALPGPFYLFDGEGRFVLWNRELERSTGRSAQEVAQAAPSDFFSEVEGARVAEAIDEVLSHGRSTVEASFLRPDDTSTPYLFGGQRVLVDGHPHVVGMGVELTELRRAVESTEFQAELLREVPNAVIATDADGTVTYWNPAAERLYGWTADEAIGRVVTDLTVPVAADEAAAAIMTTVLSDGRWEGRFTARAKDGRTFPIVTALSRISAPGGTLAGIVAVSSDDSERVRREEDRQALMAELSERVKELQVLHDAALILQDERAPIAGLVQDLAGRVPLAWKHSPDASARVRVGNEVGTSPGFAETGWVMQEQRTLRDGTPVEIDVAYLHEHAPADEGPFLSEERSLIASLTQMLITYLERRRGHELNERLNRELGHQVERLAALQRIDAAIIVADELSITLSVVLEQVVPALRVDAANVLLFDPERERLEYAHGTGFRTDEVRSTSLALDEGIAGRAVASGRPVFEGDVRTADPPFVRRSLLEREGFVSYVGLPLIAKGERKGLLELFHRSRLQPVGDWWDFATALAQQAAIAVDNRQLFDQLVDANDALQDAYDATIAGWARALDLKDEETAGHSVRVTDTTVSLARRFGIVEPELHFVRWGALLHDIGKMGVPDRILLKPDKLTDEERTVVQRHTTYAYELLAPIAFLHKAIDIPYAHHERFDGSGYPGGLAGDAIPLAARIFAIVDVFDALTSDRPYRAAWSRAAALDHIRSESGRHFDPTVVDAFLEMIGDDDQGSSST